MDGWTGGRMEREGGREEGGRKEGAIQGGWGLREEGIDCMVVIEEVEGEEIENTKRRRACWMRDCNG